MSISKRLFKLNCRRTLAPLLLAALLLAHLAAEVAPQAAEPSQESGEKTLIKEATKIVDERFELDDGTLGEIMTDFSEDIKNMMTGEIDQLISEVKEKKAKNFNDNQVGDQTDLERFKSANKILSKDTAERIKMAGKRNEGEITQSGPSGNSEANKSFLHQVSGKLSSAGTFIGHQISSLSGLAPKLLGTKIRDMPKSLRKMMHWPSFLKFKIRFNKVYKSLREELYRQMIFLRTQAIVGIQNLKYLCGRVKHLLKATPFADWTNKEYKETFDNKLAETKDNATDIRSISSQQVAYLKRLASMKKTIYGSSAPEAGPNAIDKSQLEGNGVLSRRKREYNELDDDDEEDSDEEISRILGKKGRASGDEEDEFFDAQTSFDESEDEEDLGNNLDDESKVVEDFASQFDDDADTSNLNELEDILDQALNDDDNEEAPFEPIDLRKTGCIIEPENQVNCGACFAYATVAAASYFNCIASESKQVVRYSPRFLSDCGRYISPEDQKRPLINGCHGGRVSYAIKFVDMAGVYEFMDYEFARRGISFYDDKCAYPRPEELSHWVPARNNPPIPVPAYHGVYYANMKIDQIDLHLRTVGPVFVNIKVWEGFKDYGSGIVDTYKESADTQIHSMLVVGHDKDSKGRDYFIILNSHGTAWGESGFARVYAKPLDQFQVYIGGLLPEKEMNL